MAITLTAGQNTWCTLEYADAYFEERWNSESWALKEEEDRKKLLAHAYKLINQQSDIAIAADETEDIVKQAQCELAWYILNYWNEHEKRKALANMGVTEFKVSKFSEKLTKIQIPEDIKDMLSDYVDDVGGQVFKITREYK